MKIFFFTLFFLLFYTLFPFESAHARIGVGVGTGVIKVDEKLKSGQIYTLPEIVVFNTGDESSKYEMEITYHQDQKEFLPDKDWFHFSPQEFTLEPGKSQRVTIRVDLPISTTPGDYFAYLEAHPLKKSTSGITSIGIAAATKLHFTIVPANALQGIYYKLASLWNLYAPWPAIGSAVLSLILIIFLIRRFFNIEINLRKKPHSAPVLEKSHPNEEELKEAN